MSDSLMPGLIALGVLLLIFLICRELVCWYWKLNRITALLEEINHSLKSQNRNNHDTPGMLRPSSHKD